MFISDRMLKLLPPATVTALRAESSPAPGALEPGIDMPRERYISVMAAQPKPARPAFGHASNLPYSEWPLWAKLVAMKSASSDTGIGDTIARTIGPFGGKAFEAWHKVIFGRPCRCRRRQAKLNARYPYNWPDKPVI